MPERLLVHVDDDPDEAFLFERALVRAGIIDWEYRHLCDARHAMEYLGRAGAGDAMMPSLLILDVKMPVMGGLELLEWVVEHHPSVPAIMLSSSDLLRDRLRARNLGSKGYFVKSSNHEELILFLREWQGMTTEPIERAREVFPLPG